MAKSEKETFMKALGVSALMVLLLLAACGKSDSGGDDDDTLPANDDDATGQLNEATAEEVALGVVDMIQFQQNTELMRGMVDQANDQFTRGKRAMVQAAITIPGSVPCEHIEMDGAGQEISLTISYDGVCETPNAIRMGSMSITMSGDEVHSEMMMAFDEYVDVPLGSSVEEAVPMNGTMSMVTDMDGNTMRIEMEFEDFTTPEGLMNGRMIMEGDADGANMRIEFENFTNGANQLDGFMELASDGESMIIGMELDGISEEKSFAGVYHYTLTDNGDGTSRSVGDAEWWDDLTGLTVAIEFDMTLDPLRCPEFPSEGFMTMTTGEESLTARFHCDSMTFE